jgi:enoyl-CoA hydratase/carnithine racemase
VGDPVLRRDLEAGVLLLTYNRPERNNAWTIELEEAYFAALAAAGRDPDVRVVVVTGAGRSFCPGLDMEVLAAAATEGTSVSDHPRAPMTLARSVPKPVIAAVNGACAGIGFIQACAADLRFASRTAKFTTAFARRGLPAEHSLSWLLPRLVGTGTAMDLLLSARVVLAPEARDLGLVDRLYEPDELLPEALAYARELAASCSPRSMAAIKHQVNHDWEGTAADSRQRALELVAELRDQPDFAEGVLSFSEKRPPRFAGLSADVVIDRQRTV